jgi:hypothetical protein
VSPRTTTEEEVPCETEPIVRVPPSTTTEEVVLTDTPCETTEPIVQVSPPTTTEEVVPTETPCETTEPIVQVSPRTTTEEEVPCETEVIVQVPHPMTYVTPMETPCPEPTEPIVQVEACPPQETITETLVQVVTEYKIMTKTVTMAPVPTEKPCEEVEVIVEECDETPTPIPTEEPCHHCPPVITPSASSTVVPILPTSTVTTTTSQTVRPTSVPSMIPITSGFSGTVTYFNDTQFQCVSTVPSGNALAINPKLLGFTEEDWITLWQNLGPVEAEKIPWCGRQLTLTVGDNSFTGTVIDTCDPTGSEFTDPVTGQTMGGKCDYLDAIDLYGPNGLAFLQDITGDDFYQGELFWSVD